jgi:hypothetical protein
VSPLRCQSSASSGSDAETDVCTCCFQDHAAFTSGSEASWIGHTIS